MGRYLRLYGAFLRFAVSRSLEFRFDFFFRVGMDALWYATHLAFFAVVFRHAPTLGGWGYDEALVFCGTLFVADALQMTFVSNNLHWLPVLINRGDLDYYLVRPVSALFMLTLREFATNSFLNLLMALGILGWALARYPHPLPATHLAVYAVLVLLGASLYAILHLIFVVPVFWLQTPGGLREVFYGMSSTWSRPHRVYRGALRWVLATVLPFSLIVSYPVEALFSGPSTAILLHFATVYLLAAGLLAVLWRAGLRAYSSASS